MTLTCRRSSSSSAYGVIQIATNNKVDFSYSTRMCIQFSNSNSSTRKVFIGYSDANDVKGISVVGNTASSGTLKSNIKIKGFYYPTIQYSYSVNNNSTETLTIYKIWLE